MMNKSSVTSKNSKITAISDVIQLARIDLLQENTNINFSSTITRKIVLICVLIVYTTEKKKLGTQYTLLEVLKRAHLEFFRDNWIELNVSLQEINVEKTMECLYGLNQMSDWKLLINYACEALEYEPAEYFSVDMKRGIRSTNQYKKNRGIYYTPEDIVDFMLSRCVDTILKENVNTIPTFLDCSCGAGIFLLKALSILEKTYNVQNNICRSLELLERCIWGVDISEKAIDVCKIMFVMHYFDTFPNVLNNLDTIWSSIQKSFFAGDATRLSKVIVSNSTLPVAYDCIIGNPPYVSQGKNSNLYISFVKNIIEFSSSKGCSALVLPLSVCYSQGTEFVELRKKIQADHASWEFHNYDRSPDSLFGDQVKTRNTIVFRKAVQRKGKLYTSKLQRWTSELRGRLFEEISLCDITDISVLKGIPKISCSTEKNAFFQISGGNSCIADLIHRPQKNDELLVMNGTAYNWLCVYDHCPPSLDENEEMYLSSTSAVYGVKSRNDRDFCIALLSNRIAYWYWTTIGDGFHFSRSFLTDYHIGKKSFSEKQYKKIAELGTQYCERIKEFPTVSYNAGKTIVNYSHWEVMDIIEQIEYFLAEGLCLSSDFCKNISGWYENQVQCYR